MACLKAASHRSMWVWAAAWRKRPVGELEMAVSLQMQERSLPSSHCQSSAVDGDGSALLKAGSVQTLTSTLMRNTVVARKAEAGGFLIHSVSVFLAR